MLPCVLHTYVALLIRPRVCRCGGLEIPSTASLTAVLAPSESQSSHTRLGRYETLFRIASGGMAEVYAAQVRGVGGFQKLVAIKRMLPGLAEDDRFVQMFMDEGRLAANISSPYVISTLDLGRADDDSLYLVMELAVGVSLRALIRNTGAREEKLPLPIASAILAMSARGLHDAHEARTPTGDPLSIIHRDVSPHNVLVDIHGRALITDFGIAYALQRATQTRSGDMKGKVAYFAPEQALGQNIDRRVDVFALGVVGWELMTGQRLFQADNPLNILSKVVEAKIPDVRELNPEVPAALAEAIAGALQRNPEERFSTCGEFGDAVTRAVHSEMASPQDISVFVREYGGRALQRVEDGIRSALRDTVSTVEPEEIQDVDLAEATRVTRSTRAVRNWEPKTVASGALQGAHSEGEGRSRALASPGPLSPDSFTLSPRPRGTSANPKSRARPWVGITLGLVVTLGILFGWFLVTRGSLDGILGEPEIADEGSTATERATPPEEARLPPEELAPVAIETAPEVSEEAPEAISAGTGDSPSNAGGARSIRRSAGTGRNPSRGTGAQGTGAQGTGAGNTEASNTGESVQATPVEGANGSTTTQGSGSQQTGNSGGNSLLVGMEEFNNEVGSK